MISKCTAYSLDFELDIHITIHYVFTETLKQRADFEYPQLSRNHQTQELNTGVHVNPLFYISFCKGGPHIQNGANAEVWL